MPAPVCVYFLSSDGLNGSHVHTFVHLCFVYRRNRQRVSEIYGLCERYIVEIDDEMKKAFK